MATPKKRPEDKLFAGRPPKYKPEYAVQLHDYLKQGGSFEAFCAVTDCHPLVLYRWAKKYPEFGKAKAEGEILSEKFWAEMGRAGALGMLKTKTTRWIYVDEVDLEGNVVRGPDGMPIRKKVIDSETEHPATFNSASWKFTMQNRFGWTEKQIMEHTGGKGGPIEHKLADESIKAIAQALTQGEE